MTRADVLYIALTFDADSDYFDDSLLTGDAEFRRMLNWRGIEEGIPVVLETLQSYIDSYSNKPRVTWFVRGDKQLAATYGDAGYLLEKYESLWNQCRNDGSEIGWHPHLYRLEAGQWQQENDDKCLRESLLDSYASFCQKRFKPASSRIGEAYGSNQVMHTLDELGISCDSTAMPDRIRMDGVLNIDWKGAPQHPYHPSKTDYRKSGAGTNLHLLEVPMSMAWVKAEYDRTPLKRYIDLSFRHDSLRNGISSFLQSASLLVTVTHPSAVLPPMTGGRHGLLSFDTSEFRKNLDFVFSECNRLKRAFRFITISECRVLFASKTLSQKK